MEAWVCFLTYLNNRMAQIEMQSEDATVTAMKQLTKHPTGPVSALCVNQFDGKVLYFRLGKQEESLTP